VEIAVRRGRSCRADTCGAAACFGRAKNVRFEYKKATMLDLEFVLEKGKKNHHWTTPETV
jgi:hypothetical protein